MKPDAKLSTGSNDRPRTDTIGQTGQGLPDDTSSPVAVDEATVERVRSQLMAGAGAAKGGSVENTDTVRPGTAGAGENTCRRCQGRGRLDGADCPDCGGTGIVTTPIGGL